MADHATTGPAEVIIIAIALGPAYLKSILLTSIGAAGIGETASESASHRQATHSSEKEGLDFFPSLCRQDIDNSKLLVHRQLSFFTFRA